MEIVSKQAINNTIVTGRMSNGSDRQTVTITSRVVTVQDNFNQYQYSFDHDPTDQEIADAFTAGLFQFISEDLQGRVAYLEGLVADLASIVLGV